MTWSKKEEEVVNAIDRTIADLVYDKTKLKKAYNYYNGKRDPKQFAHLEENYGIGTPTAVEFVPLIRKHIDILISEYLSIPLLPKISCKDSNTLNNIFRDKQLKITEEVSNELSKHLKNAVYGKLTGQKDQTDREILQRIENIKATIDENFISNYEIAGQNIIDYALQSRNVDFKNKVKSLLKDLLIYGMSYYRVIPNDNESNFNLEVLNVFDTFIDRNPNSEYLKDSYRSVCRFYKTKDQILAEYGKYLNQNDLETLESLSDLDTDHSNQYLRSFRSEIVNDSSESDGILGGFEIMPINSYSGRGNNNRLHTVYEVEWLKTEKEKGEFVTNRYLGIRIGESIYIPIGKDKNTIRSISNPKKTTLHTNGMFYSDKNGEPFSLILSTANLQDKYDVLCFYRDNLISESGTVGDWVDVAHLPKFLGSDMAERLMKWKAYKKQGLALYDSSQEGQQLNTSFNGFDDTLPMQAIQAIEIAIQRVEETCSTITGVFRERLGGIEQKDAVTNVQTGIKNSALITKQYYHVMDLITREILIDVINISKKVFKNGLSGTLILGNHLNKIFTALPEHFCFTDYDVHIADSAEVIADQETIKQLGMEFVKGGIVDPDIILETLTAKSLTKMKADINQSLRQKKAENDQLSQLSQQLEEAQQQMQQITKEAEDIKKEYDKLNQERINLEQEKLKFQKEIEWYKAKSEKEYKDQKLKYEEKRVQLEGLELFDNDRRNDEVRNN